jgi:hypothetical protein
MDTELVHWHNQGSMASSPQKYAQIDQRLIAARLINLVTSMIY